MIGLLLRERRERDPREDRIQLEDGLDDELVGDRVGTERCNTQEAADQQIVDVRREKVHRALPHLVQPEAEIPVQVFAAQA